MRRLITIVIMGLFFVGCGGDEATQNQSLELPNFSISQGMFMAKTLGCGKAGCSEDDNSNNDSEDENSNSNDENSNECISGNIKITDDDRDILDYSNPLIIYDTKYNVDKDTFCIRWKSYNDAKLSRNIRYSYNNIDWKKVEVDVTKKFITTKLEDSFKHNKVYIKIYFGGYNNDLNKYVGYYTMTKELDYYPKKINKAPTVNAGKDITSYINKKIVLSGVASDSDGSIVSYEWKSGTNILGTTKKMDYIPTKVGVETLTFTAIDDDGAVSSDSLKITVRAEVIEQTEEEILLNESHKLSYGYYKDKKQLRWYISPVKDGKGVYVYSLMPIKNGKAGWGVVSKDAATIDLNKEKIIITNIANNIDGNYYIAAWDETIKSDRIQSDIEKIRNSTVNINWWFFKASNNSWYIINKKGLVYRFTYKEVKTNGITSEEYDWKKINLDNAVPTFSVEDGVKKLRF